jgi:[acyl-carrier-protein] S-malonyltransferase
MKIAFLYAGQGSQKEGMGSDFYDSFPQIRDVFDHAAAGIDLKYYCFQAPAAILSQTEYTQPCMAAFAIAVSRLLSMQGIKPDFTAGLSLGEYCALYQAGVFSDSQLLSILAYRGKIMAESAKNIDAKMTAVLGLEQNLVEQAVGEAAAAGQRHSGLRQL